MPLVPFILVIFAALIHATWNLMAKRAADAGATFVFAYNLVCCIVYGPWVAWLVAHGSVSWSLPILGCILISGLFHIGYSLCLQRGYQIAPLSVVYPVARGTGPLLSSLGAFAVLRETPSPHGLLGLAAVVAGIGLISTQGRLDVFRTPGGFVGLRWGLMTGAFIAAYTVNDAYGVKALGIFPVVLDFGSNLLRFLAMAPVVAADPAAARARMRGRWRLAVGVGALSPLAYILVLAALDMHAPLSVVAPAREMSMMLGALLGMIMLREPVGVWGLVGCLVLIVGVVLLAG